MKKGYVQCENCRLRAKARNLTLDCTNCPDRMPNVSANNIDFFQFWNLCGNCFHYTSGMGGVMPISINWCDLKVLSELNGVTLTRTLIKKLKVAESLTIQEYANEMKKGG